PRPCMNAAVAKALWERVGGSGLIVQVALSRAHIEASFIKRRLNSPLWLHEDNSKANVVVATFRLEPQPKHRAAGPALVRPAPAPAHTRGRRCKIHIRIDAAGQLGMIPIAAPLEGVAVHVVQPPGIGGVTADFCGPIQRWPRLASVVWLAFEIRLLAAEFVAERRGRC